MQITNFTKKCLKRVSGNNDISARRKVFHAFIQLYCQIIFRTENQWDPRIGQSAEFLSHVERTRTFLHRSKRKTPNHPDNPVKQVLQKAETQGSCDLLPSVQRASDGRGNHH